MDTQPPEQALTRSDILEQILEMLAGGQPWTAKQMATELKLPGVDRHLVNSILAREAAGRVSYDPAGHTYTLIGPNAPPAVGDWPRIGLEEDKGAAAVAVPARSAVLEAASQLLADGRARTAKQIAAELTRRGEVGLDKSLVNSVLTREGTDVFTYERNDFTYALTRPVSPTVGTPTASSPAANTEDAKAEEHLHSDQ